jgi:HAD superfamily hydrolase (TIGR01509 family)
LDELPYTLSSVMIGWLVQQRDTPLLGSGVDLVVFDCDGVLIDSEVISARVLVEQLVSLGLDVDVDYVHEHFVGRSFTEVSAEIRCLLCRDTTNFEDEYRRKLLMAFRTELGVIAGIEDVLRQLRVPFCAATSSSLTRAKTSLEITGLAPFFCDRLFTASQVSNGKPAPDLFLLAAERMGFAPRRCLVIEDSLPGIRAARAAEMTVWRFVGASHLNAMTLPSDPDLQDLVTFDKWSDFFDMAPELRRGDLIRNGNVRQV